MSVTPLPGVDLLAKRCFFLSNSEAPQYESRMPGAGSSDFYNVTISAVTAASACITTVSLAEQAAQNGDIAAATAAIFVAQETMAAAAAALLKDLNAVRNHTNSVWLL